LNEDEFISQEEASGSSNSDELRIDIVEVVKVNQSKK